MLNLSFDFVFYFAIEIDQLNDLNTIYIAQCNLVVI